MGFVNRATFVRSFWWDESENVVPETIVILVSFVARPSS